MKQSYLIGLLFCIGLIAGAFISSLFTNSQTPREVSLNHIIETHPSIASQINSASNVSGLHQEISILKELIKELNASRNQEKLIAKPPMSHEELDKLPALNKPVDFADEHVHKDDDTVAKQLFSKVRVLCWVMTSPDNLQTKAIHVKTSWGKRCNKLLFMSDKEDPSFPAVGLGTDLGREHLTAKTMRAFDYIYKNHYNDADWFIKADDDTYVVLENLRYMLSDHSPVDSIYFGHHFKVIVNQGYFSGGAGYVLSKEALRRFSTRDPSACAADHGAEDVEIGRCMEKLGVKTGDSRDKLGRSRFHCFNPETHLHKGYPEWYLQYDKYGAKGGIENMSDYPITFHYVSSQQMYDLEYFIYHLSAYGLVKGIQDLNGPVKDDTAKVKFTTTTTTTTRPK